MAHDEVRPDISAHMPGVPKGEERVLREGPEPGRGDKEAGRTARDATAICASARDPIDPRMPHMPPA